TNHSHTTTYTLSLHDALPIFEARTMELANKIAEKSPIALQMAKESVKNAQRMNLREGLEMEIQRFCITFSSEDKEEGVKAFLEKDRKSTRLNSSHRTISYAVF